MKIISFIKAVFWSLFVWRVGYPTWATMRQTTQDRIRTHGSHSVVITTQDIGHSFGNVPGVGNELMGRVVRSVHAEFPEIPLLPQLAVARTILDLPLAEVIGPPQDGAPLDRSTMKYNTRSVCMKQREWCERNGYWPVLALTLTTPDHMPRTKRVMEKLGFEVLPIPLPSYQQADYMDTNAQYLSLRMAAKYHSWFFRPREILGRLFFLKNGWL